MVKLPVTKNQLVLEIGSGHNPHPRSDILCDRYRLNNCERQRQKLKVDRSLVIGEGQELPFKNKSFDFIYCAQVLEHARDPKAFVKELVRVGKTGLIVVPHVVRERLFGWPYHRWYFIRKNGKLIYFPKQGPETWLHSSLCHSLFAKTLWFKRQIEEREEKLNIYFYWKKRIELQRLPGKAMSQELAKADIQVKRILTNLEISPLKDWHYWVRWILARVVNKWRRIVRLISNCTN